MRGLKLNWCAGLERQIWNNIYKYNITYNCFKINRKQFLKLCYFYRIGRPVTWYSFSAIFNGIHFLVGVCSRASPECKFKLAGLWGFTLAAENVGPNIFMRFCQPPTKYTIIVISILVVGPKVSKIIVLRFPS